MKRIVAIAVLIFAVLGGLLLSCSASGKYEPTEIEKLKLQVDQKDAIIAFQNMQAIQKQYQDQQGIYNKAVAALSQTVNDIRKAHGWSDKVTFNMQTLTFEPPAPAPPPEKKKPEAPKKK